MTNRCVEDCSAISKPERSEGWPSAVSVIFLRFICRPLMFLPGPMQSTATTSWGAWGRELKLRHDSIQDFWHQHKCYSLPPSSPDLAPCEFMLFSQFLIQCRIFSMWRRWCLMRFLNRTSSECSRRDRSPGVVYCCAKWLTANFRLGMVFALMDAVNELFDCSF